MVREILIFAAIMLLVLAVIFFLPQETKKKKIYFTSAKNVKTEITAELADNDIKRMRGLMFRPSLGEKEGMLFIFPKSAKYAFWMANVSIPLEAIFVGENLTVVDILHMAPCRTLADYCTRYAPKSDAKYVIEVNEGFSLHYGVKEGDKAFLG